MPVDFGSLLWLLVVLAAIPLTLWAIKRTPLGQGGAAGTARTVAVLHDGEYHHFSLVGHGARFDLRVLRREGCVLFERDVPPR